MATLIDDTKRIAIARQLAVLSSLLTLLIANDGILVNELHLSFEAQVQRFRSALREHIDQKEQNTRPKRSAQSTESCEPTQQ